MKPFPSLFGVQSARSTRLVTASTHRCTRHRRTFISPLKLLPSYSSGDDDDEQTYSESKILPYTRKQLYDIVADVDNYRSFVPYCLGSLVHSSRVIKESTPDGMRMVEKKKASMDIGFLGISESYKSEVTCIPYISVEAVASTETPLFRTLVTKWSFKPAEHIWLGSTQNRTPSSNKGKKATPISDDGLDCPTLLSIDLTYEFLSPLHAAVSSMFFQDVSEMMVRAFEKRCIEVYGEGKRDEDTS